LIKITLYFIFTRLEKDKQVEPRLKLFYIGKINID